MLVRRLAAAAALLAGCLSGADQWVRLTTPHFELLTTAGEKKGREAILYFEQVRSFFLETSPLKRVPDFPVRIIAFRGEKQYKPYRLNEIASAYYAGGHDRDYIVMEDIQPEHYPVAVHEYTHLIVKHTGLNLPVWMNEGWAELFSTLKPNGKKAMVGALIPGRVQTIQSSRWIPLNVLAAVDRDSPLYNERDKANIFYSESWVLMHMLFLGKRYAPHFSGFVQAMNTGKTLPEACRQTLDVTIDELEKDLHSYLTGNQLFAALFAIKLDKSAEDPVVSDLGQFESDMALADLLAMIRKPEEARAAYTRLAKENPGRPEVEESLGYLAWQKGDIKEARDHFSQAVLAGSRNPQMLYHYAKLADVPDQAIAALLRALEAKPDYSDARLELGSRLLAKENYPGALSALLMVKRVNEQQAEWVFGALAFAYLGTGDRENARKNAALAKKWAKTPQQSGQADDILRYLDAENRQQSGSGTILQPGLVPENSTAEAKEQDERPKLTRRPAETRAAAENSPNPLSQAEGKAQKLDCAGKKARLTILTAGGPMSFDILDPQAVVIKNSTQVTRDFVCGPQGGYRIVVGYEKAENPKVSAGIVRTLEF